jgi:hypothetical protein
MICGVHGSPAYSETRPTWSKPKPTAAALTGAVGFFIWAQPANPVRTAAVTSTFNRHFFILSASENA